jgi:hypothetical protein
MPACETCGTRFDGRADAHYCSAACKQKATREREAEVRGAAPADSILAYVPQDRPPAWPRVRRAYRCAKCSRREILTTHGADVPECPEHGLMKRQPNNPYLGRSTRCQCAACESPGLYPAPT